MNKVTKNWMLKNFEKLEEKEKEAAAAALVYLEKLDVVEVDEFNIYQLDIEGKIGNLNSRVFEKLLNNLCEVQEATNYCRGYIKFYMDKISFEKLILLVKILKELEEYPLLEEVEEEYYQYEEDLIENVLDEYEEDLINRNQAREWLELNSVLFYFDLDFSEEKFIKACCNA